MPCLNTNNNYNNNNNQYNAVLQVKKRANAGMAKLVNLSAGMEHRGERCEGVKKEGCIKKQNTPLNSYVTNMIIGGEHSVHQLMQFNLYYRSLRLQH